MAGSISLSLSQQFDSLGRPLAGGKLNFYQAGTTATPQSAYQDYGLTIPHANPITLDAAGRVPAFYLADGFIKIRLTDKNGVTQVSADNILVVGPSSGGGGGGSVDPTTILQTGWLVPIYGTGSVTGFVRVNARTIGSATSGASERANSDTQALFIFLWNADANLVVSSGRGANGLADFQANKTITLPDFRGRALAGMDDMGNAAAGRLTSTYFGTSPTVLGAASTFLESRTLTTPNLPPYTPSGTVAIGTLGGSTPFVVLTPGATVGVGGTASGGQLSPLATAMSGVGAFTFTGTAAPGQISTPFSSIQPTILSTIYIKL